MKWSLLALTVLLSACSQSPAAPTPAPVVVPACQTQNTAALTLVNASPTGLTYDVLIDNVSRGTLSTGQSVTYTLTAGVAHTVVSRFTNTGVAACSSSPSFVQCSTQTLTCRG